MPPTHRVQGMTEWFDKYQSDVASQPPNLNQVENCVRLWTSMLECSSLVFSPKNDQTWRVNASVQLLQQLFFVFVTTNQYQVVIYNTLIQSHL